MQMVYSIIDCPLASVHKRKSYCAHLEISIFPQLEKVLFVFFSTNTETLDLKKNNPV